MKKILFASQNLCMGGVQKAMVNTIKALSESTAYEIDLFTFSGGVLACELPPDVNVKYGKRKLRLVSTPFSEVIKSKKIADILTRIYLMLKVRIVGSEKLYRSLFKKEQILNAKYDVAISYFTDVPNQRFNQGTNLFVADFINARKKLAWIHSDPIKAGYDSEYCRRIYKKFDNIVCVSGAVKEKFCSLVPEYADKTTIVHNMFPSNEITVLSNLYTPFEKGNFDIVTVCRVDNDSKRIDEVAKICKRLKDEKITDFKWRIVGDGPDLKTDIELSKELGVSDLLIFEGQKENPYPYIKKSNLFALYSAYEGYPMVIGEAQILGTYILTVNYAAAYEQINSLQGIIAKSDDDFYTNIKNLILGKIAIEKTEVFDTHNAEAALTKLLNN